MVEDSSFEDNHEDQDGIKISELARQLCKFKGGGCHEAIASGYENKIK